jgi:hypothetical protein
MMQTYPNGGTHTGLREKLIEEMGVAKTDSFYTAWLNSHLTKRDIDSMASWGFNSIRPALHYKWFTLPVEEEPVAGEQTWLETGFVLIDSLLKWCSENEMYIILDMHGTPGGQGAERGISDYDPAFPSLWESEANKTKLVELWKKIAERYVDEEWIGAYDLINETNWDIPGGTDLRNLYVRITDSIRTVDQNHLIFIEGNWFANDFTGLTPPWDENMAYSFHKYWSVNDEGSIDYGTWLRDTYNVPVWLGETGENSNVWFTNLISLCESQNVGWSFWPIKKGEVDNVLRVQFNDDYYDFINNWDGSDALSPEKAFQAMMTLAERHRFENCIIQYDVIDAMLRQPFTTELKPFKVFSPTEKIYASDYAFGRNNYAYFDNDTAQYNDIEDQSTGNTGWAYRNDGVDIQECEDTEDSNGYNVGWTNDGEWIKYHIKTDSAMLADLVFRTASGASSGGSVVLEANGKIFTEAMTLPSTGGWQTWSGTTFKDLLLPEGMLELKLRFLSGGSNLSYFTFTNIRAAEEASFKSLFAETSELGNSVFIYLNDSITEESAALSDFSMKLGNKELELQEIVLEAGSGIIEIIPGEIMPSGGAMYISYTGNSIDSKGRKLLPFSDLSIKSNLFPFKTPPARIQAEDFYKNYGFTLEDCDDDGGGKNTAYANNGDYLDYVLYVPEATDYKLNLRVALQNGSATVQFLFENEEGGFTSVKSMSLTNTGGWQEWETQSTTISLPAGKYRFRLKSLSGEHNINWFELDDNLGNESSGFVDNVMLYPNPAKDHLIIDFQDGEEHTGTIEFYDNVGRKVITIPISGNYTRINTTALNDGIYFLRMKDVKENISGTVIIQH